MNPNLTCPKCQGLLKVEHYRTHYMLAMYILQSRLVCTAPCDYKKEWPAPKELFSLIKRIKIDDSDEDRKSVGLLAGGD
jgi:C4-type Zn-finger protein